MAEGSYLRIGYLVDSDGNRVELQLPILYRNKAIRKNNLAIHEKAYHTWFDLIELDEQIGADIQTAKDRLYPLVPERYHAGWLKLRQGGLFRMARELDEAGEAEEAQELLAGWKANYERYATIRTGLWERLKARQEWWYRNLAAWLTKRYRAIVWEGDLSLREIAEADLSLVDAAALKRAQKFRGWASHYRLREFLKQAGQKNWCEIVDAPAAGSTVTCWQCGEEMVRNGGALMIVCPNGHEEDQDENAARNFLGYGLAETSQTSPVFVQKVGLRKEAALVRSQVPVNIDRLVRVQ